MRGPALGLAIVAAGACTFDSGGQGTGTSESTGMDVSTTAVAPETTSTTTAPTDTTTSTTETSGGAGTTSTSDTTAAAESTETGEAMEECNGRDDDGDGAVDEYSPMNESCDDCEYEVTDSGFVQSFCSVPLPWLDAQARCVSLGATLATADSEQHNEEVFEFSMGSQAWIGLTDVDEEGVWTWSDGTPIRFAAWGTMQPNDQGNEDCGQLQAGGPTWNDEQCGNEWPYVCRTPE